MGDNVYQVPGPQESSAAPACSLRPPGQRTQKEENPLSPCVAGHPSQLCGTLNTEDAGLPLGCGAPLAPDSPLGQDLYPASLRWSNIEAGSE